MNTVQPPQEDPLIVSGCSDRSDHQGLSQMPWEQLIATVSRRIHQSLELSEILQTTADQGRQILECDRLLIYRCEPDGSGRVAIAAVSDPCWSLPASICDGCFAADELACQEGQVYAVDDMATVTPGQQKYLAELQVKASLAVPLLEKETGWGLLIAHHCQAPHQWQAPEIQGLQQIAVQLGIAIQQASLVEQLRAAKAELEAKYQAAETELRHSQEQNAQLAAIVASCRDAIISATSDGLVTSWNQAAEQLFGYTAEEMVGTPVSLLMPPEHQAEETHILQAIRHGQLIDTYETRRQRKNGEMVDVEITVSPIFDADGQVIGASKIARDIRDRKRNKDLYQRSEAALKDSQHRFQSFMAHAPVLAWTVNTDGVVEYANPAWLSFAGQTEQSALGRSVDDLFPTEFAKAYRRNNQQVIDTQAVLETLEDVVSDAVSTKGEKRTFMVRKFPIYQAQHIVAVGGIAVDITEWQRAETALAESEARWQFALEGSGDGVWDWNAETNQVFFSRQWKTMLGYDEEEIGNSLDEWDARVHPEDKDQCYADLNRHFNGETPVYHSEHRVLCKDGSYKWILDRGKVIEWSKDGKPLRVIGTHSDIGERKRQETALNQQANILRIFYEASPLLMGVVEITDQDILHTLHNQATLTFFGATPETLDQRWASDIGVPPEHIQLWLSHYRQSQQRQQPVQFTYEHVTPTDAHWLSVTVSCIGIAESGRPQFSYIVQEITERKRLEAERQRADTMQSKADQIGSELKLLEGILEIILAGYWDWDIQANHEYLSPRFKRMFGYEDHELPNSPSTWQELIFPEDLPGVFKCFDRHVKSHGQEPYYNEVRYRHKDGSTVWVICSGQVIEWDDSGNPLRMIGCHIDITDRKRTEETLRQSEATNRALVNAIPDFLVRMRQDGLQREVINTGSVHCLYAVTEEAAIDSHTVFDVMPAEVAQERVELAQRAIATSQIQRQEYAFADQGQTYYEEARITPLWDDEVLVVVRDISTRKQTEIDLQAAKVQLSGVLNSSLDGIMAFRSLRDDQEIIIDFEWLVSNPTACKIVGHNADQLIGQRLLQILPGNGEELFDLYVQVVETGQPMQRQFHYNYDGIDSWFENIAVKLGDGFVVTFRDITATKQSELALQKLNQQLAESVAHLQQRHQEMSLLSDMSDFLQACVTVEEACAAIASIATSLFPSCSGGIFITRASRNRIENISFWGDRLISEPAFHPQDCWSLRRGRPHAADSHLTGLRCRHVLHDHHSAHTLCVPMIAQGETLGMFYLATDTSAALSESKQQLARTVAEQVAMAIANLNLRETLLHQSIRDPLTGLFNRRYLEESLQQESARAQRQQQAIGIIMIDVDHFKRFNDTFGHEAGDYVLQAVGKLLKDNVRDSDVACRYGGEEMTVVLPESSLADTEARAEEIRQAISQLSLNYNHQPLDALTASLGVACFPQHGTTTNAVLQAADAALYRAKSAGRNRVVVAP